MLLHRWRSQRADQKAIGEIARLAAATPAFRCAKVRAVCEPDTHHGIVGGVLIFGVEVLGVAPFGIRPHGWTLRAELWADGSRIFASRDERKLAATALSSGEVFMEDVNVRLENCPVPLAGVVYLSVAGSLRLCGPWSVEYQDIDVTTRVFVQVRS